MTFSKNICYICVQTTAGGECLCLKKILLIIINYYGFTHYRPPIGAAQVEYYA